MQQTLQSDDLCKLREDWLSSKPEQSEEQSAGAPVADLKSKDQKKSPGKGRTKPNKHRNGVNPIPVVPRKAVAEISKIGDL